MGNSGDQRGTVEYNGEELGRVENSGEQRGTVGNSGKEWGTVCNIIKSTVHSPNSTKNIKSLRRA